MFQLKKVITYATIAGLALATLPLLTVQAQSLNGNVSNSSAITQQSVLSNSQDNSTINLPDIYKKNGWGEQKNSFSKNTTTPTNTAKLQNVKLQGGVPSYVCNANHYSTLNSSYISSLISDGAGNVYAAGYEPVTNDQKVYKTNSAGTVTTITPSTGLFYGDIVANVAGDVFQITFDPATAETKIFKIPTGTSNYNLIYTINPLKYTSPSSFEIDSSGNLYFGYSTVLMTGLQLYKIEKLSSAGSFIQTYNLPSGPSYSISDFVVSEGGFLYIPSYQGSNNDSIYILNSAGTEKGNYSLNSSVIRRFQSIIKLPNGVTGGGVYVSMYGLDNNSYIKRIMDTDTFPISSTANFVLSSTYSIYDMFTDHNNSFLYLGQNNGLIRINVANSAVQDVLPLSDNSYGIRGVLNSANEIVFYKGNNSDLFKLDCTTTYSPTTITLSNIKNSQTKCDYISTGLVESNSYNCFLELYKGLTYVMPTELRIQISGSGSSTINCALYSFDNNRINCPSVSGGTINTTATRNIQVSINSGSMTTVGTTTSWQPFSTWSNSPITVAGQTNEILYNSKMYQVAFGTDNGLYLRSMDTSNVFGNWQRLGSITAKGTPSLSVDPNGDLYVYGHGTDNGLYYWKVGEAGGERWRRVGAITIKDAVTVHNFNGKYWLYATGTDNGLYVSKYTTFSATSYANPNWSKAGDITVIQTVQGGVIDSKLYQIAVGTDNGLYFRSAGIDEVWGSWARYGYSAQVKAVSKPLIHNNKLAINATFIGVGSSENSYVNSDFTSINSSFYISLNSYSTNTVGLFNNLLTEAGIGVDGRLYHKNADQENNLYLPNWIQGNNITIKNSPTQFTFNNKQYQFVRGSDNKLWMRSRS